MTLTFQSAMATMAIRVPSFEVTVLMIFLLGRSAIRVVFELARAALKALDIEVLLGHRLPCTL